MKTIVFITTLIVSSINFLYSQNLSLNCNINIYCPPFNPPPDVLNNLPRSVVRFRSDAGQCSGVLIAQDVDENQQRSLVLTANHCIHFGDYGQGALVPLTEWNFQFNESSPNCNNVNLTFNYELTSDVTLIADDFFNDMALVEIQEEIPIHWNIYRAGWSITQQVPFQAEYYSIHHPGGDIKKITKIPYWGMALQFSLGRFSFDASDGVLEEGSSGAPLFNYNQRVIGTYSAGYGTTCAGADAGNFAEFRNFWLAHQSVRDALTPNTLGVIGCYGKENHCYNNIEIGTAFSGNATAGDLRPAGNYQPENHLSFSSANDVTIDGATVFSGADFEFKAGNKVRIVNTKIENGSRFHAIPAPCTPQRVSQQNEVVSIDTLMKWISEARTENERVINSERIKNNDINNIISIRPNPAKNNVTLIIPISEKAYVTFMDMLGKIVFEAEFNNSENNIDISNLAKGLYSIKAKTHDKIFIAKLVKE